MDQPKAGTLFVGRDRELRELLEALDEAGSGRGRLVLIGGEPGIGKSRLADELARRARGRGCQVLWGRGWEDAGAPPYWPWVQALRTYLRSSDPDELRRQLGSGASDIAQMLPELRDIFQDFPPPPAESESARFQLFDSTVTLLRNASRVSPFLVILDDLHAADTPSILFLSFLASQLSDMRALVVGTYRDIELTPEHPLTLAIAEIAREPLARTLVLTGLDANAVGQFIGATANLAPHDRLVAAIWRETSGNPLFVGEAVRLLSAEGRLGEVADLPSFRLAVPAGVRAVIARRIGHLSEASARILRLGAALGPEFSLEVLRRIGEIELDEVSISPTRPYRRACSCLWPASPAVIASRTTSFGRPCTTSYPPGRAFACIDASRTCSRRHMRRRPMCTSPSLPTTLSKLPGRRCNPAAARSRSGET